MSEEDDLASVYLHHAEMNETREYVLRGRALAGLGDTELQDSWLAAFEAWCSERTPESQRAMDDAAAELRLREIEPPYHRAQPIIESLRAEINRLGPDAPSASLDASIEEFFEARGKPKN